MARPKISGPGLTAGRPTPDGTRRWRWTPAPIWRDRGFTKSFGLFGLPGTPLDWRARGFDIPPPGLDLTEDGPPLSTDAAADACTAIVAQARAIHDGQTEGMAPAPRTATRSLNTALDFFLAEAEAGRVMTSSMKSGRPRPISANTIADYKKGLVPVRDIAGPEHPMALKREHLVALKDMQIEDGKHSMAATTARSISRAFNWLRDHPDWKDHIPARDVYERLRVGTPDGRRRMADEAEAQTMFQALKDPRALALELGLDKSADIPPARPGAAAAWLAALWTAQRGEDVLSFNDHAIDALPGRLAWRQLKTGRRINIPVLDPLAEAIRLARATRAATPIQTDILFIDTDIDQTYIQATRTGKLYYRRFNAHWRAARALAGLKVPSLIGRGLDPYGDPVLPLNFSDARDTAVTRLFEAQTGKEGALAEIASWHGSSVKTLLDLLENYLVLNPRFADRAGDAYRNHAKAVGYKV